MKKEKNNYTQLCVLQATTLGETTPKEFEDYWKEEFGVRVKFAEEVRTLQVFENGENRVDLFFYIHTEDIPKFALPRLKIGVRWWEDVLLNNGGKYYYRETLEKYKPTW